MVMMYRSYLRNSGFNFIPALTIRDAQEVLERVRQRVIILDVVLRSEDSWRFLAELKQDARTHDIPVIIASTIEDQGKAFHLGADDYLLKPVERTALLERLRALTGTSQPARILIIDDQERDRYVLKQQFRESGIIIQEVSNGSDGIREAAKNKPNAIILDLTMPDVSGFEVLDALKASAATKDIPVVVCTSRVLTDSEELQLAGRTFAILSKNGQGGQQIAEVIRRAMNPVAVQASPLLSGTA
jgi:CheY-like chemotaxis protein